MAFKDAALDDGVLAQRLEPLGYLAAEQLLAAATEMRRFNKLPPVPIEGDCRKGSNGGCNHGAWVMEDKCLFLREVHG